MTTMKNLVAQVVAAEAELQQYVEDEPKAPVPRPPASPDDLHRIVQWAAQNEFLLPKSYQDFLEVCDGIDGLMTGFSLKPIADVVKPPLKARQEDYPELSRFVVSRSETLEFLAFDVAAVLGDELEMVFVTDDGEESRYDSFEAFMTEHLQALEEALDEERVDRKKAKKKR